LIFATDPLLCDMKKIEEGEKAPHFKAKDQNDQLITLDQYKGKKLVLYFYPKDDTPGCTAEACNLRDHHSELQKHGIEVVGVSADSASKHRKFIDKYDLPFPLLADTDLAVINAYGVWGEKKFMGKVYDGIHRTTFVIDEDGVVLKRFDKVKTKAHAEEILEILNLN
jgi:peroxiredoxin Q/BCP